MALCKKSGAQMYSILLEQIRTDPRSRYFGPKLHPIVMVWSTSLDGLHGIQLQETKLA